MATDYYCDGFDEYVIADTPIWGWTFSAGSGDYSIQTGRVAGSCIRSNQNARRIDRGITADAKQVMGGAWKVSSATISGIIMGLWESGTEQLRLSYNGNGTFTVGRAGTSLAVTANLGILANTWYHIEVYYWCHDTTGAYDLRVNGVSVASASNVDTRNAGTAGTPNEARLYFQATTDWDDFNTHNGDTTMMGDCRVITGVANAAGGTTGWTPLASTNISNVDEANEDGDTTYVSTATAATRDSYGFPALGVAGTVKVVQVNAVARKDDAGVRNLGLIHRIGSTNYDGSKSNALSTTYGAKWDFWLLDPSTAAAWTVSGVDAAESGIQNI